MAKLRRYTCEKIARFTVIDGNELVQYSSIQNRDQRLKRLFSGIPQNDCS